VPGSDVLGVGGPLAAGPSAELIREAFGAELEQQRGLAGDVGLADLAYAVVLVESGSVPPGAGAELLAGLLELQAGPEGFAFDPALGDVYTNREAWLSAHCNAAGWLGFGRARREAITTGYALAVRKRLSALARALAATGAALADVSERHAESLMPDYTYLQAGQPTSFGHYLLGFAYPLLRDLARARASFAHFDRSPAGCGSTNGSSLPIDRRRLAALLGFEGLVEHARDAMWQPDGAIEALALACAASVNLDRLAEDLTIFSTAEFGFVALDDAHSRASKVMPQKKNPFSLAYVRAVANRTIGVQAGIAAAARTPSGQMDNRFAAYGDVPAALERVAGAAGLMTAVVRGLTFDAAAARTALERSFAFASDLAELVVRESGLDYRAAHDLVARAVRESERAPASNGRSPAAALDAAARATLGRALTFPPGALEAALDPALALARRSGLGGAAPSAVAAMIADVRARLAQAERLHALDAGRIEDAERALFERARQLARSA
jgi:argininosuccinate lyase